MLAVTFFLHLFFFPQQHAPEIINGYTSKISVYPGDSLDLFLNASYAAQNYRVKIYDLSGSVVTSFETPIFPQAERKEKSYEKGFDFKRTCRIAVPAVRSGIYLIANQIPLIVKAREARITIVYPSNTINAYCATGGKSLYGFNSSRNEGANIVSFLRPMGLPRHSEAFFRWLQNENMQDIGYIDDADLEEYKSIGKSKLLIIPGHSEYWTVQARKNFDRFVQSGMNALVLSGNTMWWQVRYNKTKDQLICYRESSKDPVKNERLKTINWFEPSLNYPIISSIGAEFRNGGYGVKFFDNGWDGYKIIVDSPLLAGTSIKKGDVLKCSSDETDGTPLISVQGDIPIIDYQKTNFSRIEIVGFDKVQWSGKEGFCTWIVFKPSNNSGTVINTASTDWCSSRGIGTNDDIKIITRTMIKKLRDGENVFSTEQNQTLIAN